MLELEYEITVPERAEFIGGYYSSGLDRDQSLNIVFRVSEEEAEQIFSQNWEGYETSEKVKRFKRFITFDAVAVKDYKKEQHTICYISMPDENGMIICGVSLRWPSRIVV